MRKVQCGSLPAQKQGSSIFNKTPSLLFDMELGRSSFAWHKAVKDGNLEQVKRFLAAQPTLISALDLVGQLCLSQLARAMQM